MIEENSGKIVLGLTEEVKIKGRTVIARIDTGAQRSSICKELAEELKLGPVIKQVRVRSSTGKEERPVIEENIEIKGKKIKATFNIANRSSMNYSMLIGQEILREGFLVDPSK